MKLINKKSSISYTIGLLIFALTASPFLGGCGKSGSADSNIASVDIASSASTTRNNDIKVLKPVATGEKTVGNDSVLIDYSNASEGYIVLKYTGDSEKVKFQIAGSNQVTYTYDIAKDLDTVIPLTSNSGTYLLTLYETIGGDQYATNFTDSIEVEIKNEFGPYLYPNQYVNFNEDTKAVKKAQEIVADATCDLEAVALIYDYVASHVEYDHSEAVSVSAPYLPDVDEVLSTGKGICFDYSSLMAAMLRSQGIPTRLEIGYAKDAYHAWISTYTEDQGWIGGVIQFDGTTWTLMDPTLASNSKNISKIKEFIGDGSSYNTKYVY